MDLISEKSEIQNSIIFGFDQLNGEASELLLDKVFEYIDNFTRSLGKIIVDKETGFQLAEIAKKLNEDFKNSNFKSKVGKLLSSFDDIDAVTIKILETVNGEIDLSKLNFSNEKQFFINQLSDEFLRDSFKVNIVNDIKRIIAKNIIIGSPIKDLKNELKASIGTSINKGGILGRYSQQLATDAVLQYGGIINQSVANNTKANALMYTGSLIETSRVQCKRWVNDKKGILLLDQKIAPYGYLPDEVKWAIKNGTSYGTEGKTSYIPLSITNFARYRGGYNCRHEAIPFTFNDVQLKRAERLRTNFEAQRQKLIDQNK